MNIYQVVKVVKISRNNINNETLFKTNLNKYAIIK